MTGLIHITPFAKNLIDELTENQDEQYYEIYEREDFKIDDAKEVIAKSYLIYEQERLSSFRQINTISPHKMLF